MDIYELYQCFQQCTSVTTDTRSCQEGAMFFALKGDTFNGNQFARQALLKGCRYAVVDEPQYAGEGVIVVDNCLQALQQLARLHRRQLGLPVIGITGTNGKTTTKELIAAVLKKKYNLLYTQGNLNNHIGVPLTLLLLRPEHQLAVVEMGASHPGDIKELVEIAEPDYGLITNVGMAHLQGFGSFEGVVRTKGELYDYLRSHGKHVVFIDFDNEHLTQMAQELQLVAYETAELGECAPFLSFSWQGMQIDTQLIGTYNLKNAQAAITVGRYFGVGDTDICQAIASFTPHNNRSQLTITEHNRLVVDAYNANPTSMKAAIDNFRAIKAERKMVILGDMKELGEQSGCEHQKVVCQLLECGFERTILVGEEMTKANNAGFECYPTTEAVKHILEQHTPHGCYVLIKGSNSMKLHQLVEVL